MVKQISDNEIYLLIKYIKSVLWRVVKRLSYIEDARCLKVNWPTLPHINVISLISCNKKCFSYRLIFSVNTYKCGKIMGSFKNYGPVELTSYPQLVPRVRIRPAIPSFR